MMIKPRSEEDKIVYVPWYQTSKSFTDEFVISQKLQITQGWGHSLKNDSSVTVPTINIHGLETIGPYATNFLNNGVKIHQHKLKEFSLYKDSGKFVDEHVPQKRTRIFSTANSDKKNNEDYFGLVPRQIQHIEPHRIEDNESKSGNKFYGPAWLVNRLITPENNKMSLGLVLSRVDPKLVFKEPQRIIDFVRAGVNASTMIPAAHTILKEIELGIDNNHDGIVDENTRKEIEFILLRHGESVINNSRNIIDPGRIQYLFPCRVANDELSKGKVTYFITKQLSDNETVGHY